jgi:hypothetical protein
MPDEKPDREWVPTSFFLAVSDDYTTEIAFSPRQFMRNEALRYTSTITVYDPKSGRPRHHVKSPSIGLPDCIRTSSEEIRPHLKSDAEFFYCEAFNIASAPPVDVNVAMPSNVHYHSKSGRLQGDLGSNYIYGSPRKAFKGEFYYDHFPLGRGFADTTLKVILMNPYVRPSDFKISFTSRSRRNRVVAQGTVPGKAVGMEEIEIPVTKGTGGGLAVVVASELKLNAVYGLMVKSSGVMCGLDHGHPFLMQRLGH